MAVTDQRTVFPVFVRTALGIHHQFGKKGVFGLDFLRAHLAFIVFVSVSGRSVLFIIETLLGIGFLCRRRGVSLGFDFGFLSFVYFRNAVIGLYKQVGNLTIFVGFPEFQVGGSLQKLAHPFRLLHTRQLHHDAAGLRQALDIGLGHAETVDTGAQHHKGIIQCGFRLLTKSVDHICVGGVGLVHLQFAENRGQAGVLRSDFPEGLFEQGNEIALGTVLFLPGQFHGFDKQGILGAVAGQGGDDVGDRNLQGDVHATFQVQTQIQLQFLAFPIRPLGNQQIVGRGVGFTLQIIVFTGFRGRIQQIGFHERITVSPGNQGVTGRIVQSVGFRLVLHPTRAIRKRQGIQTNQRKRYCKK